MKTLAGLALALILGGCVEGEDHFTPVHRGDGQGAADVTPGAGGEPAGAGGAAGASVWFPINGSGGAGVLPSGAGGAVVLTGFGGSGGAAVQMTGVGGAIVVSGAGGAAVASGAGGAAVPPISGAGGSGVDPTLLNIACISTRGCFGGQVCYNEVCGNYNEQNIHPWTTITCEQGGDCQYNDGTWDVYTGIPPSADQACQNGSLVCDVSKHCACL